MWIDRELNAFQVDEVTMPALSEPPNYNLLHANICFHVETRHT